MVIMKPDGIYFYMNDPYMEISFHVAARTVTGSKLLVAFETGEKILLDC